MYDPQLFGSHVDPFGTTTLETGPVKTIENKDCGCCCCVENLTITPKNPKNQTRAGLVFGKVDMEFKVAFTYTRKPAGIPDSEATCLLAFIEFPVSGTKLPTGKVKYTPGQWNDPIELYPSLFKKWSDFDHPNANPPKCNGTDELPLTDEIEVYFKSSDFVEFYQAIGVYSGGPSCGCKKSAIGGFTHVKFAANLDPNGQVDAKVFENEEISYPNTPQGVFPLPRVTQKTGRPGKP